MLYIANNMNKSKLHRRGASLVEVLVALVILVIGILSIIRLFPGGFIAIRNAQDDSLAQRLAQGQLEELKQNRAFLINAVYMYTPGGAIDPAFAPTDVSDDYPSLANPDQAYNDINKTRYIDGESFTVPAPDTNAAYAPTEGVSLHTLNEGPVVINLASGQLAGPASVPFSSTPTYAAPADVYGLPQVHSGAWTAKMGNAPPVGSTVAAYNLPGSYDNPSDLLASGGQKYAIDYTNEEIAVPPALYTQYFTLQLNIAYPASGSGTSATPAETITYYIPLAIPASNAASNPYIGGWFDPMTTYANLNQGVVTDLKVPSGTAPTGWIPGSAVLTCTLTPEVKGSMTSTLLSDLNPYTYLIYTPAGSPLTAVNLGVMEINPRLVGQTVYVSYLVYNWHIIHQDVASPASSGTQLPLDIDHIQPVGSVLSNQGISYGLFRRTDTMTGANGQADIVVLDTDTGDSIALSANNTAAGTDDSVYNIDTPTGNPAATQFQVSYQNGYIVFPTQPGDPWLASAHPHLRVFYRGDFDWAVALQKAPDLFTLGSNGALAAGQYAISNTGGVVHLHFPVSDMGQTVEADSITYTDTNGAQQQVNSVSGTITTDFSDSTPYIALDGSLPNMSTTNPNITIAAVRGISVRSVVIWKERGNWKTRSISTILNQTQ